MKKLLFLLLVLCSALLLFSCMEGGLFSPVTLAPVTTTLPDGTGVTPPATTTVTEPPVTTTPPVTTAAGFDFSAVDLRDYLTLAREDFFGITVKVDPLKAVTDLDVEDYILEIRESYMTYKPSASDIVAEEDRVSIYYWGEIDGVAFFGGSNMADASPYQLVIGSGKFIAGFENSLIGVDRSKTGVEYGASTDTVGVDGSIIHISYSCSFTDQNGTVRSGTMKERIDLATDTRFSSQFHALFEGKHPGDEIEGTYTESLDMTGTGETLSVVLTDVKLEKLVKSERTVAVKATFPENYGIDALNGKTATFHVVITEIDSLTLPEVDVSFLTDTLKLTLEDMAASLPEDLPDDASEEEKLLAAFPCYVRDYLEAEAEAAYENEKIAALWNAISDAAEVTQYPEDVVEEAYDSYYTQVQTQYYTLMQQYSDFTDYYPALEDFILYYYGTPYPEYFEGNTATEGIMRLAQATVKEQMVLYYIVQTEEIALTEEETLTDLKALLESYAAYYSAQYGYTISTDDILNAYSLEYFLEELLYQKTTRLLLEAAVFE